MCLGSGVNDMSRMSERYDDLLTIQRILLGQRKVQQDLIKSCGYGTMSGNARIECINDLLLEFEAAGIVWPGNVVSLEEHITKHVGPPKVVEGDFTKCWPKEF
jgi:hypothetical protein